MPNGLIDTACLIFTLAVLESSYRMAYYDELTGIPGRRAFNESLLQLRAPYTIAIVDVDHFKGFNDLYGHDVGDDVLRMVANKLASVTAGGKAFRVGGEEFNVIFAGKPALQVHEHLERIRAIIESTEFRLRGSERRAQTRGAERRRSSTNRKRRGGAKLPSLYGDQVLSVTVSIGFAEATLQRAKPEHVITAADQALYQAKASGRNRVVEFGSAGLPRTTRRKKASANLAS
jgi:diguanylate cyclase (GGDEF)-like protein